MKIAICLFPIMDWGGIINHTEQMAAGLQELGHEVEFFELIWREAGKGRRKDMSDGDWRVGATGIPYHQFKGWNFPATNQLAYKNRPRFVAQRLGKYDAVIWTIPVPTKNSDNERNVDWPTLYENGTKNFVVVHDGNSAKLYPHLIQVEEHLTGVIAVHNCALETSNFLSGIPRFMVVNPQRPIDEEYRCLTWKSRRPGFVSMQTFKAWKRVEDLVRAIPFLPPKKPGEIRMVAGEGIEYRYMVSEDKRKAKYYHAIRDDFRFSGAPIWESALACGMDRPPLGYLPDDEVDDLLHSVRILIDPSYSKSYAASGGHFNRVVVDAIRCGAVPLAVREATGNKVLRPNKHYFPIDRDVGPTHYAEQIHDAWNMPSSVAEDFRENGRELFENVFHRRVVCQKLESILRGQVNADRVDDERPVKAEIKAREILTQFFRIDPCW